MFSPKKVFNVIDYPLIIAFHASIWSCIYKNKFLKDNKITVIESKSASYQDFPFMIETMTKAKRISVVHKYLVHYRMEEGQGNSTMRRDERLLMMVDMCIEGKNKLKLSGLYDLLKEEFYFHCYLTNYGFFNNILFKYKHKYFEKLQTLFNEIQTHKDFKFKYFSKSQKKFILNCINNKYLKLLTPIKRIRQFLISIRFNKYTPFFVQILGIQFSITPFNRPCLFKIRISNKSFEK